MLLINNIKVPIEHDEEMIKDKIAKLLRIEKTKISKFKIVGQSIDARNKNDINYIYSAEVKVPDEKRLSKVKNTTVVQTIKYNIKRFAKVPLVSPVIIGSGPAGLFAALILAEYGLCPIIIERGKEIDERDIDVKEFFKSGMLNVDSNVQFGEGGAGTYSDGKLTTNTHDFRISKVIDEFIKTGAPAEIAYMQKPHIGTDCLVNIMKNIRVRIQSLGGEYRFQSKLVGINKNSDNEIQSVTIEHNKETYDLKVNNLVLAIGHSSRDTFKMLYDQGVKMQQKPFAVGVRIEHKQSFINESQFGRYAMKLPQAEYKLNTRLDDGRGVYTFCMCPGGQVVAAASEENKLVTNGMSYSKRDMENANSALLVNVNYKDFGSNEVFAGMEFQEKLESAAFELGGSNYFAPVQLVKDFLANKESEEIGNIIPSYLPGYKLANLQNLFSTEIIEALKFGLNDMERKIKGFSADEVVLTGVETRSSSPVRIVRDDLFNSSIKGVMPCGEGAGYAGGIMSAAVDGILCAEAVVAAVKAADRKEV